MSACLNELAGLNISEEHLNGSLRLNAMLALDVMCVHMHNYILSDPPKVTITHNYLILKCHPLATPPTTIGELPKLRTVMNCL